MSLQTVLLVGLLGAILLFCGDMTLYYDKNDYRSDGTLDSVSAIMKQKSRKRLYLGGIIGPVAAFLYCIGFYHLVLFVDVRYSAFAWACFLVNCLGIICGGVYHCYFATLGLVGRYDHEDTMDEVLKFLNFQKRVAFGVQAVGFLAMALFIVLGWTVLPWWMVFFTPLTLVLLTPLMRKLPKGFHIVICGGWTNLISVIYYAVALTVVVVK